MSVSTIAPTGWVVRHRWLMAILLAVLLAISGCVKSGGGKPTVGVTIRLSPTEAKRKAHEPIEVTIDLRTDLAAIDGASVHVEVDGAVQVKDPVAVEIGPMKIKEHRTLKVVLLPTGNGTGRVRAIADLKMPNRPPGTFVAREIYLLASDEEVLLGSQGTQQLKKEHLDRLYAAGKIGETQYKDEIRKLTTVQATPTLIHK